MRVVIINSDKRVAELECDNVRNFISKDEKIIHHQVNDLGDLIITLDTRMMMVDNYHNGYKEGYRRGKEDGIEEAGDEAYDDGYNDGKREGGQEEFDRGYEKGYDEGYNSFFERVGIDVKDENSI